MRPSAAGLADIADKVEARERLSFDDAVTLFESTDLLALGWIANRERERRHGDRTYFNHNLRLEATNVCEASCLFCSFARLKEGMPGSHTMSLEQVFDKLRQRGDQPLTEMHIVNGLHPGLPFSYYTDLLSGLEGDPPRHPPEVLHRGRDRVLRGSLRQDRSAGAAGAEGGGPRLAAGRRRRDLRAARAPEDLPRQVRRRPLSRDPSHRARPGHAHQRDDALRAHRDDGGARRSPAADARAAGRDRRLAGVHPAGVPSRQQPDAQAARRRRRPRR